jgi:hypothetical protein
MKNKPNNIMYFCEGESEELYLQNLFDKQLLSLMPNKKDLIKKVPVNKIIRKIVFFKPMHVILCYDYKENNIKQKVKDDIKPHCKRASIKLDFPINSPNFDHIIAHHFESYKGKNAKEFLKKIFKKYKKIIYDEIIKKGGKIWIAKEKCPESIMKHIKGDK